MFNNGIPKKCKQIVLYTLFHYFFNQIISLKHTQLFFFCFLFFSLHFFKKYSLLFLDDSMDEWSSLKCGSYFLWVITFKEPSSLFVSWCLTFHEVLMKELAHILIHVRRNFNCRVSFKMMLFMYLVIVEKRL